MSVLRGQRALVTGSTGFIGRRMVAALLNGGVRVVALARTQGSPHPEVEVRTGDVTDPESLRGAADGCDFAIHLVGLAHQIDAGGGGPPEEEFDNVNVSGTAHLLDELRRAGTGRILYMSSVKAAGESSRRPLRESDPPRPEDAYGRSKLRAEALVREFGAEPSRWSAVLRPPLVYGPGNRGNLPRLLRLVERGVPLPFGMVRNARSIIYVDNLVEAALTVLERTPPSGEVFFVADDPPLSTPELIRELATAAGVRPRLLPVPETALWIGGRLGDALVPLGFPLGTGELRKLIGTLVLSDAKIRGMCGYAPAVTTREGLRMMADAAALERGDRP